MQPTSPSPDAPRVLVFGASGQVGAAVVRRVRSAGMAVLAVSRQRREAAPGIGWLQGELDHPPALPARVDAIFSCGPLDGFARWLSATHVQAPRVVAFGSTSIDTKAASADPAERALAGRLAQAEATVFAQAGRRGMAATVLRPTLVYGAGRDASLTRIATLARRTGWFPLPRGADGLRQPVHVDDLAVAALACLARPQSAGRAYALPGGERLPYREMVARVLACLEPAPRLVELPRPLFRLAVGLARAAGRAQGLGNAVERMGTDLVFEDGPARRDLEYAPRPFHPHPAMFSPPAD